MPLTLPLFQVDAFTDSVFSGNPAAVCPLDAWLDDGTLQAIAGENNLSETAFFVDEGPTIALRWFTPVEEVDLCGHATLAAAHVLRAHLGDSREAFRFATRSGELVVTPRAAGYAMDFPGSPPEPVTPPPRLVEGLGARPREVRAAFDYVAVFDSEAEVRALAPDHGILAELDRRGVVATAPGESADVDFVSRCFFPRLGIDEDPVTGSAHCELAPYWRDRLGRDRLRARQVSPRGGVVGCEVDGPRVILTGRVADYLRGEIRIDDQAP